MNKGRLHGFNRHQLRLIRIMQCRVNNLATLQSLSKAMGYRPSRLGILPVLSTLNAIQRKHADLIVRVGPKDQWSCEAWGFNHEAGLRPELFECKCCFQMFDRLNIDMYSNVCNQCSDY